MDTHKELLINSKRCIIEFQAFRGNDDKFIIKELVILDLLTFIAHPFTFEAPFSFNTLTAKAKKTNKWLSKHFHHIKWYDGYICYTNLHSIMFHFCKQYTHIYTRGEEKRNWIQRYTHGSVYDINVNKDFKFKFNNLCIATQDSKHGQSHCALHNAYRLAAYLEEKQTCGKEVEVEGVEAEGINTREQDEHATSILRDSEEVTSL